MYRRIVGIGDIRRYQRPGPTARRWRLRSGPFWVTQTNNSAWVLTANMPNGSDNATQFNTGFANANNTGAGGTQMPGTGTGVWYRSFTGNQSGGGTPLAQSLLQQDVVATAAGDDTLNFVAGRETFFTAAQWFVSLSSGGTGGSTMVDLPTAAIPKGTIGTNQNPGGTPFSMSLSGVTAGDTLSVIARMVDGQDALMNPQSAFLDNFVLVPEPTTGLLGVMGMLAMLGIRRRS